MFSFHSMRRSRVMWLASRKPSLVIASQISDRRKIFRSTLRLGLEVAIDAEQRAQGVGLQVGRVGEGDVQPI